MIAGLLVVVPAADAAKPKLSISDARATEGQPLTFKVTLSKKAQRKVRASYATATGSASASDFVMKNGTVRIKRGKRGAKIRIRSSQDSADEPNETFSIALSNPKGAKLARRNATGRIVDDDVCTDGDADGVCVEDNPPDCNDQNPLISPNLTEISDNLVDDDCNASTPDGMSNTDQDSDGWSVVEGDCNDTLNFVYPGASELQNRIDDDCDGLVDETN